MKNYIVLLLILTEALFKVCEANCEDYHFDLFQDHFEK